MPDGAVEQPFGKSKDVTAVFAGLMIRIWNYKNGKYRSHLTNKWVAHTMLLKVPFETHPKTGVELWQRVHQIMMEQQTKELGKERALSNWLVQQPETWYPTIRWEGEDMILEANRSLHYQPPSRRSQFILSLKIAEVFGFMKQDPTTKTWSLGPNLIPSYPLFNYFPCGKRLVG